MGPLTVFHSDAVTLPSVINLLRQYGKEIVSAVWFMKNMTVISMMRLLEQWKQRKGHGHLFLRVFRSLCFSALGREGDPLF